MTPESARPPLRVGLLMDSFDQPAWVVRILERIREGASADIVCVVLNDGGGGHTAPRGLLGRFASYWRNRRRFIRSHKWIDSPWSTSTCVVADPTVERSRMRPSIDLSGLAAGVLGLLRFGDSHLSARDGRRVTRARVAEPRRHLRSVMAMEARMSFDKQTIGAMRLARLVVERHR